MASKFDVLKKRSLAAEEPGKVAKRGNPDYKQFAAYLPVDLHKQLQIRLAERGIELSQAAEEAITAWLGKGSGR